MLEEIDNELYKIEYDFLSKKYLDYLSAPAPYGDKMRQRSREASSFKKLPFVARRLDLIGRKVFVWSDLHFGHKNIIQYSERPFPDVPTMDQHLIDNFNEYVGPDDISIWVGDVAFYRDDHARSLLYKCNGKKILVVGNHDFEKRNLKKLAFNEVHLLYWIRTERANLLFTHYPMDMSTFTPDWVNVHGHEHIHTYQYGAYGKSLRHINVNCEIHGYKPIELDLICQWAHARVDSHEER